MTEQEKKITTMYGEQTERDVIRTLVGELEHINKLFKWQMDQGIKMRKALQAIRDHQKRMPNIDVTIWELTNAALGEKEQ